MPEPVPKFPAASVMAEPFKVTVTVCPKLQIEPEIPKFAVAPTILVTDEVGSVAQVPPTTRSPAITEEDNKFSLKVKETEVGIDENEAVIGVNETKAGPILSKV